MVLLTCDCLNVKIDVGETDLNSSCPDIPSGYEDCDFFRSDLMEAKISPSAIHQEHSYLVHKAQVKDWLVHRCVNCGLYTHAVPSLPSRKGVLVSKTLLSDPDAQERLTRSSDYSPLFRVVLRGQDPNMSPSLPVTGDSNSAFHSLQSCISHIQQDLNTFLLQEEAQMEERVRVYQDEQRDIFSELEERVKNDKKKMISILFNNMQTSSEESTVSMNGNRPVLRPTKSVPMASSTNSSRHKGPDRRSENAASRPRSLRPYDHSPDSEPMFMLDDDDDDDEDTPFSISDEEDTDDSIQMDDARRSSSSSGNLNSVFSTSVPISVPVWKPRSPRRTDLDDKDIRAPAPDQMAASMQALARSVHNNDVTNLFGELPRPRLSTFSGVLHASRK
ncbi:uncharacterized protein LOC135466652 [Liolophura sinensis]|uniref:uncharacterized protein LOC135466652 n=1 Tax=Liolophura sinensis TaxID=3198878 RepID=UPI00315845B0